LRCAAVFRSVKALTLGLLDRIDRGIGCAPLRDPFLPGAVRSIGTVKEAGGSLRSP